MKKSLSKSDIKQLNDHIKRDHNFDSQLRPKDRVEIVDNTIILVNNRPQWFYHKNLLLPTIHTLLEYNFLPKMIVDMGAVPFVTKGADVFRPGVIALEDGVKKGDIVCIIDERHKKPLALAHTLIGSEEFRETQTGKIAKIIHYVGDRIWEMMSLL